MATTDVVQRTNVDWAAILAGAVMTTAIALILLAFGSALGLTVTSPFEGEGWTPAAFAIAAGLWLLWVQLVSFYAGGYVAARLRARGVDANEHEVDVRDGLHGLLVWATGVIIAAVIAFIGIGGVTTAARTAETRNDLTASVSSVVQSQVNQSAAEQPAGTPQATARPEDQRRAEVARKLSIISAFITAAAMLAGAVAAFFGAGVGGNHRDRNTVLDFLVLRRPSTAAR